MAVDHKMAELNTTWGDMLKEIPRSLNWSYAVLWARTDDRRNLIWKQGYFNMRRSDDFKAEMFHTLYSKCRFAPGFGFAGQLAHGSDRILWLTADKFDSVPNPVPEQTYFLRAAGIQTVVCVPLDFPSSSFVLELGTVPKVQESLGQDIKNFLWTIRASGLELLIKDSPVSDIPAESSYGLPMEEAPGHGSLTSQPLGTEIIIDSATSAAMDFPSVDPARTAAMNFSPSTRSAREELLLASQRHTQFSIYSELLQPLDQEDSFLGQSSRGISQIPVGIPDLPTSSGLSPRERFESPWAIDSSLLPMSPYHSWVATSTMDAAISGMPSTSSGMSSRLGGQAVDLSDEMKSSLEQLMAAASDPQRQQSPAAGAGDLGAIRRMSPSSSPGNRRSQTGDDSAIPAAAAVLQDYDKFHISELEAGSGIRVSGVTTAVAGSSSTLPAETESYSWGGVPQTSGPSSKETSPDSNVPLSRTSYGIRPTIDVSSPSFSQAQRQPLGRQHSGGFPPSVSSQRSDRLEQHLLQNPIQGQETYAEGSGSGSMSLHSPTEPADSTPMLVQFGNVLQLGNAAGQVSEALPQEHDEAAVSHMLAERRRRTKQNENFTQLKSLIPSAAKMDKASLLAATITYINDLKDKVKSLEQNNETLKRQLEQHQSPKEGLLRTSSRGKGSPPKPGSRGLSYADADRIQVTPDGDGNLHVEMKSPCNQPDSAMAVFGCLKEMHFNTINANVKLNDNWIYATIIIKTKRKNSQAQSEVCAEVEQALKLCLNMV